MWNKIKEKVLMYKLRWALRHKSPDEIIKLATEVMIKSIIVKQVCEVINTEFKKTKKKTRKKGVIRQ